MPSIESIERITIHAFLRTGYGDGAPADSRVIVFNSNIFSLSTPSGPPDVNDRSWMTIIKNSSAVENSFDVFNDDVFVKEIIAENNIITFIAESEGPGTEVYVYVVEFDRRFAPENPFLEIGIPDGINEWNYFGEFNEDNVLTNDFAALINSYLSACPADSDGYCEVPLTFHSETPGKLHISDINITYINTSQTQDFSASINTALNYGNCDCTGCSLDGECCIIPLTFYSDSPGILKVKNLRVIYESLEYDKANLNGNGFIDIADLAIFQENFLMSGPYLTGDINRDKIIDLRDFAFFAQFWLFNTCSCR